MVTFQISRRGHVGDWWWVATNDQKVTLFSSPLSFETAFEVFTKVKHIQREIGGTTKVVIMSEETDTVSILF